MLCTIYFFVFVFLLKTTQKTLLEQKTSTSNVGFTGQGKIHNVQLLPCPSILFPLQEIGRQVLSYQKTSC